MEWLKFAGAVLIAVIGSSALSQFIKSRADAKAAKAARINELEDRRMDRDEKKQSLEARFDRFCTEQRRENAEIRQRLAGVEATVNISAKGTRSLLYSDLFRNIMACVKCGEITPQERISLNARAEEYMADYGKDASLVQSIDELNRLRTIPESMKTSKGE